MIRREALSTNQSVSKISSANRSTNNSVFKVFAVRNVDKRSRFGKALDLNKTYVLFAKVNNNGCAIEAFGDS